MQIPAHNLLAQYTDRQLNINTKGKTKSGEKLSSGYRINRAADDAAGLHISEKMRWQIRGLNRGQKNTLDGISWIQTADGAMDEITQIIQRIRELAVQGSNDTNTEQDRAAIDSEIKNLRKEINRISVDTEFNTQDIFDNSYVTMDVIGSPDDLQVFNASYNDATGEVAWGGFVFHGERITWDTVNPGMVEIDPVTNEQIFTGGDYSFTNADGYTFHISCEAGSKVPDITRTIALSANNSGVSIDGKLIGWNELIDEDEKPLSASNIHGGTWTLNYEGAQLGFFINDTVETISDIAKAIDSCNDGKVSYTWKTAYIGETSEKAVDATVMKNLRISNTLAQSLGASPDLTYVVRAGNSGAQNGIWLEKADGTMVNGSYKAWADLTPGISSWDSGTDINSSNTYTYTFGDASDAYISFDFKLSDITSTDSVIDGLDGMEIKGEKIKTNYVTNLNATLDGNLLKATATSKNPINFFEELTLGRDFDTRTVDNVANADIQYDASTDTATLDFSKNGTSAISYTGNTAKIENELASDVSTYLSYVLRKKTTAALEGLNADQIDLNKGNLTDLVGAGNITTSGYFDSSLTIQAGMTLSDGKGSYHPGEAGKNYPAAYIDFSGLGNSYGLDDLVGLGFNSTCKTCDNHYSIAFVTGASGGTTVSSYEYNFKGQGKNYVLQIDVDSLKNNGVATGADLAEALTEITSDCYDFHYTQYAADGNKLWVYDNRTQNSGTRDATFDTAPFNAIDTDEFHLAMKTADGREIDLTYVYDYGDIADRISVQMTQDAGGDYVKNDDGSYASYNPAVHTGVPADKLYRMDIVYQDNNGNQVAGMTEAVNAYVADAMEHMLGTSNLQLDAADYTYMQVKGDENSNVAIRAIFDSKMEETPYDNGIHIQNSSNVGDDIKLPRFSMNSVMLHLFTAGTRTFDQAQSTIVNADYALSLVSDMRSTYGAYQNRLEHTIQNSANAEENQQAAESRIRDTDMAAEIVTYSMHSVLEQAGQSMLAQANQQTENILRLLQA